jgi:hypothetical protein
MPDRRLPHRQPARQHPLAHVAPTSDVPRAGFYKLRLVRGGVHVGVRLWEGPPLDPVTRRPLDRSWRWQACCDGRLCPVDRVWPWCVGEPIGEDEYRWLLADRRWARSWAPGLPEANPREPVSFRVIPDPF